MIKFQGKNTIVLPTKSTTEIDKQREIDNLGLC